MKLLFSVFVLAAVTPGIAAGAGPMQGFDTNTTMEAELAKRNARQLVPLELMQTTDPAEAMKIVSTYVVSTIPVIGGPMSVLVQLFWPQNSPNIWEMVVEQVQQAIDVALLQHKIEELTNDFIHIKNLATKYEEHLENWDYDSAPVNHAAANQLDDLISDCERAMLDWFGDDDERHLYLPLALPTAIIHLTALHEKYRFSATLYGNGLAEEFLAFNLDDAIETYTNELQVSMNRWKAWRKGKVSTCARSNVISRRCCQWHCLNTNCVNEREIRGSVIDHLIDAPKKRDECGKRDIRKKIVWQGRKNQRSDYDFTDDAIAEKNKYVTPIIEDFEEEMSARHTLHNFASTELPCMTVGEGWWFPTSELQFAASASSWHVCGQLCRNDANCNAYTFRPDTHPSLPNTCQLLGGATSTYKSSSNVHYSCPHKSCRVC